MKKIVFIIISILTVFLLFIAGGIWYLYNAFKTDDPDFVLDYISEQADTGNVSLAIARNGETMVQVNEKQPLPLASTMKIIVAIEYAQQAAEGKIDPHEKVPIHRLDTYYIDGTDGGAHEAWLQSLHPDGAVEEVAISEIAKGMINYSSNANTDYLIQRLGLDEVNDVLIQTNLEFHEPIYPIGAGMMLPFYLMKEENLSKEEALQTLEKMPLTEYVHYANDIFQRWSKTPPTTEQKEEAASTLDMKFQRIWSDCLPRGVTADYLALMEKLNSKQYFSKEVHAYLDPVMEGLMENPQNQAWLKHAGQKGGSTAFVLTMAMYAEDQDGNKTELACFVNELGFLKHLQLTNKMNSFQLALLTDDHFRLKVEETFN